MTSNVLHMRPMTRADLDMAVEWAAIEGWNPGWHDADTFHAADPGGFLLGCIGDTPVAAISAVRYGARFGFIGFYIVRPEFRGQGHGIAIWRAAMGRLAGRTIGLDGVVAQQESYRRSGFALAWNNVRHEVIAGSSVYRDPSIAPLDPLGDEATELIAYDALFFPDDRSRFMRHWIAQPGSTTLTVQQNGRFAGYGTIRPCRLGFKIGLFFADDADLADRLLRALIAHAKPGEPVQLDTPAANPAALALARAHAMRPVFETARMYAGQAPALPLERIFGITTYELG